eukprot:636638-Pyramimonas_sp.AAC.2
MAVGRWHVRRHNRNVRKAGCVLLGHYGYWQCTYLVTGLHQPAHVDADFVGGEGGGQELASLITEDVEHL